MEAILCQPSLLCRDTFEWIMEKQQPFLIKVTGSVVLLLFVSSGIELFLNMSGYMIIFLLFS